MLELQKASFGVFLGPASHSPAERSLILERFLRAKPANQANLSAAGPQNTPNEVYDIISDMYIIVGLGNPGEEHRETRHNTGRMALDYVRKGFDMPEWEENKKIKALSSEGKIGKEKVMLIEPETFMNKSGASLMSLVKSKKAAEKVIVVYDDLDLPVGRMKVSFNRSSGGHKGVESIIKAVKTEAFARIRVGISPVTAAGKTKKPSGDEAVADFILGKFSPKEYEALKKIFKTVPDVVAKIISDGVEMAMGEFNH